MNSQSFFRFIKRPAFIGLFIFTLLLLLTQFLSYQRYLLLKEIEQRELFNESNRAKEGLQSVVSYSFATTQTLAFIVENYGIPANFDSVAKRLLKANPNIDLVEIVQGGIITHVYPLPGNESVIGFNILTDSARKSGALTTIEKRDFYISGPLHLKQGGVGFVSRVPIFKNNQFWGFSAAVIKLSTLLQAAGIDTSINHRFAYQLNKVNTETGEEESFLPHHIAFGKSYLVPVELPNTEWKLYVVNEQSITFSAVLVFVLLGFLLSVTGGLFAWYIAVQPSRLKKLVAEKTWLLQASEQKYKNTLDRITDGFAALDHNGYFTYFNKKAGEILKRDPEKMIGKQLWAEFPDSIDQQFYTAYFKAQEKQKHTYSIEYNAAFDRWLETDIYPSPDGMSIFFRDITKRKKAEEELHQANNRFEMIARTTNDALWEWNLESNQLWCNEIHQELYGLTMADPVPTHDMWAARIHPQDREFILHKQEITLASNQNIFITEYRFQTEEQGYRNLYDRCYIQRNKEGKAIGLTGSIIDITERKTAENQVLKEKELSDSIINSLPGIFYLFDSNRVFMRWNKNFETVSGYTAEELPQVKPIDFYENEGRKLVQENFELTMRVGEAAFEANFVTKAGKKIPYYFTGKLVYYEGRPCLLGTGIDISERKRSEIELQKALNRYNILAKATSDTIWDWDMQTHLMSYNEGVTTMLGYEKSVVEHIPDWWKQNIHPDDFATVSEMLDDVFRQQRQTMQLSYRFRCADGLYKYIFDRAFVIYNEEQQPIRMIGAMQDVTYEKEEEIRISKAIVDAQEAERQQIGMELHDNVNQILSVSLLFLGMAKEQQASKADFSETINTCIRHITDAINEIRTLSHQLAPASKDDISFKDVFESLIESLTVNSVVAVHLHFSVLPGERIRYDIQTALYRIMQEQLNNIFKHADATAADIWVTLTDGILTLKITDNGKGFDPKLVSKGIGLRNIKRRAEMYGGKFSCISSLGKGTELIVGIPLNGK